MFLRCNPDDPESEHTSPESCLACPSGTDDPSSPAVSDNHPATWAARSSYFFASSCVSLWLEKKPRAARVFASHEKHEETQKSQGISACCPDSVSLVAFCTHFVQPSEQGFELVEIIEPLNIGRFSCRHRFGPASGFLLSVVSQRSIFDVCTGGCIIERFVIRLSGIL